MNTIAEFTIIGRVGEVRQVGTTLRVNMASSYIAKDRHIKPNEARLIHALLRGRG